MMRSYDKLAEPLFAQGDARALGRGIALATIIAQGAIVSTLLEHSETIKAGRVAEHMSGIITPFERFMAGPAVPHVRPVRSVITRHDKAGVTSQLKMYVIIMLGGSYLKAGLEHMRTSVTPEAKAEYMKRLRQYARSYDTPVGNLPNTVDELMRAFSAQQVRIPVVTPGLRDLVFAVLKSDWFLREAPTTNPTTLLATITGHLDSQIVKVL